MNICVFYIIYLNDAKITLFLRINYELINS